MAGSAWIWILVVFIVYFIVLIGIAVLRTRQMDEMSDYVLGGGGGGGGGAEDGRLYFRLERRFLVDERVDAVGFTGRSAPPVQSTTTGCAMIQRLSIV